MKRTESLPIDSKCSRRARLLVAACVTFVAGVCAPVGRVRADLGDRRILTAAAARAHIDRAAQGLSADWKLDSVDLSEWFASVRLCPRSASERCLDLVLTDGGLPCGG